MIRRILLFAVILVAAAMAYVMHVPLTGPVHSIARLGIPHIDKLVHFSAYLLLSLTLCAWLWIGQVPVLRQMLIVVVLLMGYSAIEEWSQQFSAGRKSDVFDWCADVLGFTLGCTVIWSFFRWGPHWLKVTEQPAAEIIT